MEKFIPFIVLFLLIILIVIFHKQISLFIIQTGGKIRIQKNLLSSCKLNDYLLLNDIYFPIDDNKFRYIDTIIFGNKYIYVVKEIIVKGNLLIDIHDNKWRVVNKKRLSNIDNPLIENQKRIDRMVEIIPHISKHDFKSVVLVSKNVKFDAINNENNEFVIKENNIMLTIINLEKNSNNPIIPSDKQVKLARSIYNAAMFAEKEYKHNKKKK